MALFRRRGDSAPPPAPTASAEQVAAFWAWWTDQGRALAEGSIAGTTVPEELAEAMTREVHALDAALAWELTAGETSEHVLVVTAEGDPRLRALARRVVLAAPPADATWSYVDTRPPTPDPEAVVLGSSDAPDIDFARVQVSARLREGRFDVTVHHPAFPELPPEVRTQVTFLALDSALGEVATELWVGEVHAAEVAPLDGFGLGALRSVVRGHQQQALDDDGRPRWALLQGETSQGPLVAMAQTPLHPLMAPHLDTHLAVVLPYADHTEHGLPGPGSLDLLRDFEEQLGAALGPRGTVVAHQSVAGVRTLHVYADATTDAAAIVERGVRSWPQGRASLHEMHDPGWEAVAHLRS